MIKRAFVVLQNEQGQYLHDVDETKQIIWTNREEYFALFDRNDKFGQKMMEGVEQLMKSKELKWKWVKINISLIF